MGWSESGCRLLPEPQAEEYAGSEVGRIGWS